jgi:hypothetical protein
MPCPHYLRENSDCLLLREPPPDEEERADAAPDDPVARDLCLSPGSQYRDCPVFRRYLADLLH